MADKKLKYEFRRSRYDIKDIVHETYGGNPKQIANFIEGLATINSIKNLFSQSKTPVNTGDGNSLFSVNLKSLEDGVFEDKAENHSSYLFPSDLVRALSSLAIIFRESDSRLHEYATGEFIKVIAWGDYDRGYKTINEVAFIKYFEEIQKMLDAIVNAYKAHGDILKTTDSIKKISAEDLKKIAEALEKNEEGEEKKKDEVVQAGGDNDGSGGGEGDNARDPDSATMPPTPPPSSPTQKKVDKVIQKGDLSRAQKQKIQYETGWLYNRAVYEMFTAHGIETSSIDPSLLKNLRSDIYKFTSGMDDKKILSMLGSASKRQEALLKFYPKFAQGENKNKISETIEKIVNQPSYQELSNEQKAGFEEFRTNLLGENPNQTEFLKKASNPDKLFEKALTEATGLDSPEISENAKSTLEAMIIQYGSNQQYIVENPDGSTSIIDGPKNKHDAAKIIDSMSEEKIRVTFGLPEASSSLDIDKFKKTLTNYVAYKAPELAAHTQNTSLSRGVMRLSAKDFKKLNTAGSPIESQHREFLNSTRAAIKQHGAETVVVGTKNGGNNRGLSRKQEKIKKIQEQYRTFVPLWENLSAVEQRIVYDQFGIPYNKGNKDATLGFIKEFLLFDVETLDTFRNIQRSGNLSEEDQELALSLMRENKDLDLASAVNQASREQRYGRFATQSYVYFTEDEQLLLIADYINGGEALKEYPDASFFNGLSADELANIDRDIQDTNYQLSDSNSHLSKWGGLSRRLRNTDAYEKFSKRFGIGKGRHNPAKKMAKAFDKSVAKAAFKGIAAASNFLLPGSGKLLYELARKIGFKKAGAIMGSLLALLIAKTLYALSTVGGLIGGLLGGAIGFIVAGGPLGIAPGLIVGANIGQAIMPASWFNTLLGGKNSGVNAEAATLTTSANTATAATSANAIAAGSGVFFGLPIALLAPGIATFVATAVTIHTIFVIQSAFLVPTPPNLKGVIAGGSFKCDASSIPKPDNTGVIMSDDGKYAFPMINSTGTDNCSHWDGDLAIDIYTGQKAATDPQRNLPLVAYVGGRINMVVRNDSLGGIYVILKGDDNRFYYYAHLCASYVVYDQRVEVGEVIGITNQSGLNAKVTPEHLHFAIQEGGESPDFYDGGNICPFTDFREKFGMELCTYPGKDCVLPPKQPPVEPH